MTSTIERFSNRVENYVKHRPGYPPAMLQLFRDEMGLDIESVIADIGSGPGNSARPFLENGNTVYGVEPNTAMRAAAEALFTNFPKFKSVNGTAENTTLSQNSVDFVLAAQAFHWFEPEKTREEFRRILKPGGYIALVWNERQLDTTPFLRDYENLLQEFANDYGSVRHDNITGAQLETFFQTSFSRQSFENVQVFDYEGILGRLLSSSYMPAETDARFAPMSAGLAALFAKHAEGDRIKVFYDTNVFFTQV